MVAVAVGIAVVVVVVVGIAVGIAVVVVVGIAVGIAVVVVVAVGIAVAVAVVVNRAFARAEQARRRYEVPTPARRRALPVLARKAGIELPVVRWRHEASDALRRLERTIREPTLGPM